MDNEDNDAIIFAKFDFSHPRVIAIAALFVCSALLSIIGSTTILVKILRDWARNGSTTPYDRFMIGLSCGDIMFSIIAALTPLLSTIASPASCHAFGVLVQLGTGSTWYNGLLSCYFLMTVLSQVRRKNFLKRCEPWMHLSVMYCPILAILSYSRGWWHPNDRGTTCEYDPIATIVGAIPVGLALLLMIVNYSVIYAVVRKTLQSSNESSENVGGSTPVRNQLFRESTTIMALYVGSFLVTWLPYFVLSFVSILGGDSENIFGLVFAILSALLLPLQGVFNAMIYLKPFYTRFRAAYPNKSKWFVLQQAVLNSKAPRMNHRRVANHHTYHSDFLITDITLGEDNAMNPNEALFYPGRLPSSSDSSSNDIAEGEDNGAIPDNVEESKEHE